MQWQAYISESRSCSLFLWRDLAKYSVKQNRMEDAAQRVTQRRGIDLDHLQKMLLEVGHDRGVGGTTIDDKEQNRG
jgi:hypothetical protein